MKSVFDVINKLPSTEPKAGKWLPKFADVRGDVWVSWKCNCCGYVRTSGWEHTSYGDMPEVNFCENCGARMEVR